MLEGRDPVNKMPRQATKKKEENARLKKEN
jgi:hypothetical protein